MNYDFDDTESALRSTLGKLIEELDESELMARLTADDWLDLLTEPADGWNAGDFAAAVHAFEQFGASPGASTAATTLSFVWPLLRYLDVPQQERDCLRARLAGGELVSVPVPDRFGEGQDDIALLGASVSEERVRAAVRAALPYHLTGLTAQAVGGSEALLRRTVRYVSEREQFGQPIAGFQAVRHKVADMYTRVENSRAVLFEAAWRLASRAPDADTWVHAARVYTAEAYLEVCESAIQCHGGIGFTWEAELHRWYRHAIATSTHLADVRLSRRTLTGSVCAPPA